MDGAKVFIFVCGSSRSGTTMMSRILGNHSSIFAFQELHFFDELASAENAAKPVSIEKSIELLSLLKSIQREGYFGPRNWRQYEDESIAELKNTAQSPMDLLLGFLSRESHINGKSIPCEQTPQTVFALDALLQQIPTARVVLMVRDPREVLLSQKGKWKRRKLSGGQIPWIESVRSRINYHPITISRIWKSVYQMASTWEMDSRVMVIKYEDLVSQPDIKIRSVCVHLGLNFEEKMLDIPITGSSNFNDVNSSRGVVSSRTGKWREGLTDTEIFLCQTICSEYMAKYGYKTEQTKPLGASLFFTRLSYPIQLAMALPLNFRRIRKIRTLLKRFIG